MSVGTTRWLLRKGLNTGWGFLFGLLDMLAAAALLTVLAVVTVAAVQGLNLLAQSSGAQAPLVDIAGLLQRLKDDAWDPALYWMYVVVLSTFLPSFAHAMIAASSLLTARMPQTWLDWHREGIQGGLKGDHKKRRYHARFMTVCDIAPFVLAVLFIIIIFAIPTGLGLLFWQYLGAWLLFLCEETARLLGAEVLPVQPVVADFIIV